MLILSQHRIQTSVDLDASQPSGTNARNVLSGLPRPRARPTSMVILSSQGPVVANPRSVNNTRLGQGSVEISTSATPMGASRTQSTQPTKTPELPFPHTASKSIPKPNFSAFQQHYTPKKQTSRDISSESQRDRFRQVVSRPSSSFSGLRDELLQLQLLYHPSHKNLSLYKATATSALRRRHEKINAEIAETVKTMLKLSLREADSFLPILRQRISES